MIAASMNFIYDSGWFYVFWIPAIFAGITAAIVFWVLVCVHCRNTILGLVLGLVASCVAYL